MTAAAADFTHAETFRVADARKAAVKQLLGPMLLFPVALFLILWFVTQTVFVTLLKFPEGPVRPILSALSALVIVAGITALWLLKAVKVRQAAQITVSPTGIEMVESNITRNLAWQDITHAGPVVPLRGVELKSGASSVAAGAAVGAGVNRTVQALSASFGILGRGTIVADRGGVPKEVLSTNNAVWGTDDNGVPYVGIAPDVIVEEWFTGRIGDWLRHYRPDIAQVCAQRFNMQAR